MRKDEFPLIDAYVDSKVNEVLDKIRAEIEQEYLAEGHLSDYWDAIDKCLQIVDANGEAKRSLWRAKTATMRN